MADARPVEVTTAYIVWRGLREADDGTGDVVLSSPSYLDREVRAVRRLAEFTRSTTGTVRIPAGSVERIVTGV